MQHFIDLKKKAGHSLKTVLSCAIQTIQTICVDKISIANLLAKSCVNCHKRNSQKKRINPQKTSTVVIALWHMQGLELCALHIFPLLATHS